MVLRRRRQHRFTSISPTTDSLCLWNCACNLPPKLLLLRSPYRRRPTGKGPSVNPGVYGVTKTPRMLQIDKRPELQLQRDFSHLWNYFAATTSAPVTPQNERCAAERVWSELHINSKDLQEQNAAKFTTETIWGTNCWRSWGSSWVTRLGLCTVCLEKNGKPFSLNSSRSYKPVWEPPRIFFNSKFTQINSN